MNTVFERTGPLYRAETHAGIIAGPLEMNERSEYEMECDTGTILEAVERVERIAET